MHCLPISNIYVMSVESYAKIERKRLLMMKIQNMMISFTDYRNDYLKRINLEV